MIPTHGNKYQAGFPDLYCFHYLFGERWVEVKILGKESFTEYQMYYFPLIKRVWILKDTSESEYLKLFKEPNYDTEMASCNYRHNKNSKPKEREVQDHGEGKWQEELSKYFETQGYTAMHTYGNNIQRGLPDVYLLKGAVRKWLELKRYNSFTTSQRKYFPLMFACKIPIWILEYKKEVENRYYLELINKSCNLRDYL